ncbi:hypothetical protein NW762_006930 [Fusarium torreyae]|uniref:Extracellular membrane protein CFEM domain-containing protein n=1 Tax=Fusarium torreyae TaxID=1237075 RepID=A0A9W8RZP3_9HYPO|nr:hypothetical protein NW762_006930 [Fusarium torreyae]
MTPKTRGCSGHGWGFIAPDVKDPPQCISLCRERFMKELLPKDETFERVCEALQDKEHMEKEQPFRALYCCDAQACGVDNLGEVGKDHPGPPQPYDICDSDTVNEQDEYCQEAKVGDSQSNEASESTSRISSSESTTSTEPTASETASVPIQSSIPDTTYSTSSDPSILASSDPSSSDQNDNKENRGMPLGVKVTIAVISVVGLIAIAALVFCLLRRRYSRKNDIRRLIKHPTSPPPADSPTPLVSPTISHADAEGVPLTPPARLRERRFLPTLDQQDGFPSSPLFSPTSNKLTPRHERTPRIYSADQVPMIVMTAPDGGKVKDNDGSASFSDRVITPPASVQMAPLGYNPNTSPPRPPRSRDASFKILASPGPPPTRALPSTPPIRPSTPTSGPLPKGISTTSPNRQIAFSTEVLEHNNMAQAYMPESRNHSSSFRY